LLDYQIVSDSLRDTDFYGVSNITGFAKCDRSKPFPDWNLAKN